MLLKKIEKARKYSLSASLFEVHDQNNVLLTSEHGIRQLTRQNNLWSCDCEFYAKYKVCSHAIAAEELLT